MLERSVRSGGNKMSRELKSIRTVHTLGPTGTNCELAAKIWTQQHRINGEIKLHASLELAIEEAKKDPYSVLLSCVVYPDLHKLVFNNLNTMEFVDSIITDTYRMVLASKTLDGHKVIVSHPAPASLIDSGRVVIFASSNSQAALDYMYGIGDACITTSECARRFNMHIIEDYGTIPMLFALHRVKERRT